MDANEIHIESNPTDRHTDGSRRLDNATLSLSAHPSINCDLVLSATLWLSLSLSLSADALPLSLSLSTNGT